MRRVRLNIVADSDSGPWPLPIVGFEVYDVWFSGQLYVIAYGDPPPGERRPPRAQIAFGGEFVYQRQDGQGAQLDAQKPWETAVSLLSLRHARVIRAVADREGNLEIVFDNGSSLIAGPDERYENWTVSGAGFSVIAPPGGGDPRITWERGKR